MGIRSVGSFALFLASRGRARLLGAAAACCLGLVVAGCSPLPVRSNVTTFHEWPADSAPKTFELARSPAQEGSLEHAAVEKALREELVLAGFAEAPGTARYLVRSEYSVETRPRQVVDGPAFAPSMVWAGGWRGGFGMSMGIPFGWPSYPLSTRDVTAYERRVKLVIEDRRAQPPRRAFESTAVSLGSTPGLIDVLPQMLKALLQEFPGPSGVTRVVDVKPPSP